MLGLLRLSREYPEFDRGAIGETALRLAGDEQCGELTRITAVQVCGQMDLKKVVPVVRRLAVDAKSVVLRTSAIAALGQLGGGETLSLLERLASDANGRVAAAARSAAERVRKRSRESGT